MREIKFRAWDKTNKAMYFKGDSFGTTHDFEPLIYLKQGQDVDVMQYTGLKDKNGKGTEMCQGDLVRAYGHGVGKVEKNHWGEWVLVFEDSVETIHDLMMEQDLGEIVGTKYENPELLEVVK